MLLIPKCFATKKRVALIVLVFLTFLLLEAMGEVISLRDWNALVYGVYKVFSMNHFQLYISVDTHPQIQA